MHNYNIKKIGSKFIIKQKIVVNLQFKIQKQIIQYGMTDSQIRPDYIFEVSWEVCNLVGGIYTVLSTKAKTLQKCHKDKVVFVGPDVWQEKPSPYFIEDNKVTKAG